MQEIVDREFSGATVRLDGYEFKRCRFVDSQLVLSGEQDFAMDDCSFDRCRFKFEGAGKRVVALLRHMKAAGVDILG